MKNMAKQPSPSQSHPMIMSIFWSGWRRWSWHRVLLLGDEEYLDRICDYMGVESFAETTIQEVKFHIPYAAELIPTESACVEDTNELAFCL